MKLKIFFLLLIALPFRAVAQEDNSTEEDRNTHWGFVFGLEGAILDGSTAQLDSANMAFKNVEVLPGFGVSGGMSSMFYLSDKFSLRPQVMISIIPTKLRYDRIGFEKEYHLVYTLTADIPVHLVYNSPLATGKPGGYLGGAMEIRLPGMDSSKPVNTAYALRGDLGLTLPVDLGIGHYLLDICYSYSLTDLIEGTSEYDIYWSNLHRHRFGLRLHFY